MASNTSLGAPGTLKRPPLPPMATFRAPSSSSTASSSSPSVPPPMNQAPTLPRPGILKHSSLHCNTDIASGGVCAVPNCSANCGRPQSILKNQPDSPGFNSSCQQCIEERAAAGSGVNTVSK